MVRGLTKWLWVPPVIGAILALGFGGWKSGGGGFREERLWERVYTLTGNPTTHFVAISKKGAMDLSLYKNAAAQLCGKSGWCEVVFFESSDIVPEFDSVYQFNASGGRKNDKITAIFVRNGSFESDDLRLNCNFFRDHSSCM